MEQSTFTAGFQEMKSEAENVPNMVAMRSHVSLPVIMYQAVHWLLMPSCTGDGKAVTVGGCGKSEPKAPTQ